MNVKPKIVGRYSLHAEIAAGGMATVHLGKMIGPVGFSKIVALKRLHPQFSRDPEFVAMFLDEARLTARIQHPNVVSTLDIFAADNELFLVMEYLEGETLSRLLRSCASARARCPPAVAVSIMADVLHGLHHAHEAKGSDGEPLDLIHRDVSPANVMVGVDGSARLLDFGVAKAAGRMSQTRTGEVKGKLGYMAPELITHKPTTRQIDIYAAGVVLWELLVARRLFVGDSEGDVLSKVLAGKIAPVSATARELARFDAIIARATSREPSERFASARAMAIELEKNGPIATPTEVGDWVRSLAGPAIEERARLLANLEAGRFPPTASDSIVHELPPPSSWSAFGNSVDAGPRAEVSPTADTVPSRRGRRWPAALALVVLVALAITALVRRSPSGAVSRDVVQASASTGLTPPISTAEPSVPVVSAAPTSPPSSASQTAAPGPPASAGRLPSPAAITRRSAPAAASAAARRVGCDPPYSYDENGRKQYKLNCLRE